MIYELRTISYANTTQYGSNERNHHLHPPYFLFFSNQT